MDRNLMYFFPKWGELIAPLYANYPIMNDLLLLSSYFFNETSLRFFKLRRKIIDKSSVLHLSDETL